MMVGLDIAAGADTQIIGSVANPGVIRTPSIAGWRR
jgi:hypothetical protein